MIAIGDRAPHYAKLQLLDNQSKNKNNDFKEMYEKEQKNSSGQFMFKM